MSIKAETVGTVERERERESYTLLIKSVALLSKLTHTHVSLIKKYIYIEKSKVFCVYFAYDICYM